MTNNTNNAPWAVVDGFGYPAVSLGGRGIAHVTMNSGNKDKLDEYLRLIAAAPDLLEAAQSLLITWRCSLTDAENDAPTLDQFCEYQQILGLEAAIKKAKGEV